MKPIFPGSSATVTALVLLQFLSLAKSLPAQLRAAAATADTTPVEFPVSVNGGMRDRFVDSASDPLHARSIVLENGGTKLALCIVDLCVIPDDIVHAARKLAAEATGIPTANILIAATHTHTAPTATPTFQSDPQANYLPHLTKQIAKSIIDAHANLGPAEAGFASHSVPQHVHNRRWLVAEGATYENPFGITTDRAWMNPGFKNPEVSEPAGPVDPEVCILAIRSPEGRPIAVLANYSLHYVGNVPALSADYFGQFATIAKSILAPVEAGAEPGRDPHPPFVAILSNGTSADVNNIDFSLPSAPTKAPYQQARLVANDVAQASAQAWKDVKFSRDVELESRSVTLELGVRKANPDELARARKLLETPPPEGGYIRTEEIYAREAVFLDKYPDQVTAEIQAIQIGDLSIGAIPCETFTAIGLELKEKSPFAHHFTISLANGYHGYLPTEEQHALGGYETWRARSSYVETGASPKIVKALLGILTKLQKNAPPKPNPAPLPKSPEESLASIHVPGGYAVELVVAEPDVMDPVAIDWDARGRLWVVEMADYPLGIDGKGKPGGRVRVLEDADRDGKYEKNSVFLEGLSYPNGIKTWRNGVLITAAPDILYAEDTDGDDKADKVEPWFTGFGEGNQQLRVNGLRWSVDGWLHLANGKSAGTVYAVDKPDVKIDLRGHDCRIRPDTREIEATTGTSQFGLAFDNYGERFGCDNSYLAWHVVLEERHLKRNPHVTYPSPIRQLVPERNPPVYPISKLEKRIHADYMANRFTSACGICIYRDGFFFDRDHSSLQGRDAHGTQYVFTCEPVHNVVTRRILNRQSFGVTYSAKRDESEETSEFMASEDNRFRPVMARTGPDGTLWIVDMYRDIVEHPHWVPKEIRATWEKEADLRAGHDRGRIYRVVDKTIRTVREGKWTRFTNELPPVPEFSKLPPEGLVALLGHQNGTVRDTAQQLLMWGETEETKALIRATLADPDPSSSARLHALGCFAHAPTSDDLSLAAKTGESAVVALAFRIAESLPEGSSFPAELLRIATPESILISKVYTDAVTALGSSRWSPANGQTIAKFAAALEGDFSDSEYRVAALSTTLPANLEPIADALAKAVSPHPQLVANTLITADKMDKFALVRTLAERVISASDSGEFAPWQFEAAALFGKPLPDPEKMLAAAAGIAADTECPEQERSTALRFLAVGGSDPENLVAMLENILTNPKPAAPEVATAALEALARQSHPRAAGIFLSAFPKLSPATRATAIDALLRRTESAKSLLESIQAGTISPSEVDNTKRNSLLNHKDEALKALAAAVFARPESDRTKVVAAHRAALDLKADPKRGKEIFALNCAVCHQLEGVGNPIGPDLRSVTDRSPVGLLTSILDPTAQMEPIYQGYVCETVTGEFHTGLVVGESGGGVEIVGMDAKRHAIPGSDIKSLKGTGKSFMPEGLETAMSKQDLADLIRYLGYPE